MKTFWMSFVVDGKFVGVSIVEATTEDYALAKAYWPVFYPEQSYPTEQQLWIAAATQKSHKMGCNPGGEIGFQEYLSDVLENDEVTKQAPRHRLMGWVELLARDLVNLDDIPPSMQEEMERSRES